MSFYAQYGNTIVLAVLAVLVWFYLRGRFELIDRRFERVESEIVELRRDTDRKFELLMTEINAVRSDLTNVALAVGALRRPEANQA